MKSARARFKRIRDPKFGYVRRETNRRRWLSIRIVSPAPWRKTRTDRASATERNSRSVLKATIAPEVHMLLKRYGTPFVPGSRISAAFSSCTYEWTQLRPVLQSIFRRRTSPLPCTLFPQIESEMEYEMTRRTGNRYLMVRRFTIMNSIDYKSETTYEVNVSVDCCSGSGQGSRHRRTGPQADGIGTFQSPEWFSGYRQRSSRYCRTAPEMDEIGTEFGILIGLKKKKSIEVLHGSDFFLRLRRKSEKK